MINILQGLNTVVSPASAQWKDGAFSTCTNMRIASSGKLTTASGTITPPTRTVYADNGITNYAVASFNGSYGTAAQGAPTVSLAALSGARMESGIYYYIATKIDQTSGCEGISSGATEWYAERNFNGSDARINDVPAISLSSGYYRIYRTKAIYAYKGGTLQRVQKNSPTEFFYVGSISNATTLNDYLADDELGDRYEGRGGLAPTSPAVIQAFDGRLFAFYSGYALFSAVGRPLEFPQKHTITYTFTYTNGTWAGGTYKEALSTGTSGTKSVVFYPRLENGLEAEARLWLPELIGKTIVDAYEFKGKLWVWTATTTGYIVSAGNGYRYVHLSEDFGIIASTLCLGDAFLYGCDTDGAWVLGGDFPKRLSYGVVAPASITGAEWKNATKEYWFGKADDTDIYIYNAMTNSVTSKVVPSTGTYPAELMLWLQMREDFVKENIRVTIITEAGAYKCTVYQGGYPDTSLCATSGEYTFAVTTPYTNVQTIRPNNSGRFIGIKITADTGSGLIISGINVEPRPTSEYERNKR